MLAFLRKLAVYFGLREDDTHPDPGTPAAPRNAGSLVVGALVVGTMFALITTALGGFDDSIGSVVVRGAVFGLGMGGFWYMIDRAGDRGGDHPCPRQERPPSET